MASRPLALRFLSGPHQGAIFALDPAIALVMGRGEEVDLVLQDELVSRRHARLSVENGELKVEDLGSTNGTFVNGIRTERGRVAEGDRILVGATLMRVVSRGGSAPGAAPLPPDPAPAPTEERVRRGRLEETPLPDLLQLLA
ncbi:MAG TPA: FHA domain-containing protein, partial [Anaeromyxobacteraceae bacterium]|nr:FHA domain-containing protein [Anaeromyxobacteraceae bacterium]